MSLFLFGILVGFTITICAYFTFGGKVIFKEFKDFD